MKWICVDIMDLDEKAVKTAPQTEVTPHILIYRYQLIDD